MEHSLRLNLEENEHVILLGLLQDCLGAATTIYLGRRRQSDLVQFNSSSVPTRQSQGHLYTAVISPFKSKVSASYFARYGRGNPHIQTADDTELLARADPLMEQAVIEESMNNEELANALECDALDQSEYSPIPNIESIQTKTISQGATCRRRRGEPGSPSCFFRRQNEHTISENNRTPTEIPQFAG
ncbi:MAG TPA: hypothetical protein VLA72_13580 [Anaerolineales bacterium]|nr:hypothetical protein [Anaerolineales bacterium]